MFVSKDISNFINEKYILSDKLTKKIMFILQVCDLLIYLKYRGNIKCFIFTCFISQ